MPGNESVTDNMKSFVGGVALKQAFYNIKTYNAQAISTAITSHNADAAHRHLPAVPTTSPPTGTFSYLTNSQTPAWSTLPTSDAVDSSSSSQLATSKAVSTLNTNKQNKLAWASGTYSAQILSGGSGTVDYGYAKYGRLVFLSGAWWGVSNASGSSNFIIKLPYSRAAAGPRTIGTVGYSTLYADTSYVPKARQYPVIASDDRMGFCYGTTDVKGSEMANATIQWSIWYMAAE